MSRLLIRERAARKRRKCVLIKILTILLQVLILIRAEATSNIHSVWLSSEKNESNNLIKLDPWRKANNLQVAASSLQPAIVAFEQASSSNSNRRNDLDLSSPSWNNSTTTTTASDFNDRIESTAQVDPFVNILSNNTGWSSISNAQVQFDDPVKAFSERRQDNNETSTLSPQYDAPSHQPAFSNDLVGDLPFKDLNPTTINASFNNDNSYLLDQQNEQKNRDPAQFSRGNSSSSFIYYLPDGDKWNSITQSENAELPAKTITRYNSNSNHLNNRRKLHTAGTQYDLRERQLTATNANTFPPKLTPTSSSYSNTAQSFGAEPSGAEHLYQLTDLDFQRQRRPHRAAAPANPAPEGYHYAAEQQQQGKWPQRNLNYAFIPLQASNQNHRLNHVMRATTLAPAFLYAPRPAAVVAPQFVQRPIRYRPESVEVAHRRHRVAANRAKLEPSIKPGSLLTRYIKPTTSRPKKSLLGALGSRFNSWTDASSQTNNLESSFYETAPSNNYYQLDQSILQSVAQPFKSVEQEPAGAQPQLVYPDRAAGAGSSFALVQPAAAVAYYPDGAAYLAPNAIQQPTVAPATRYFNPSARRRRVVPPGDAQRPAGFIPVVAVSVTRTSPAPSNPQQESQAEEQQVLEQPQDHSSSAIDDYLEMKLGNQNNRKNNNDEYFASGSKGSAAMMSANRQPVTVNKLPATTTTVKSALFGYLPHQAEQPLLQAFNILPQQLSPVRANQDQFSDSQHHYSSQETEQTNDIAPVDEAPSLALQLQANSLVQNDIAHSFYDRVNVNHAPPRAPFDVFPANQAQYHGFRFVQPNDHSRDFTNPLLNDPRNHHHHPQLMATSAGELNPAFMFAPKLSTEEKAPVKAFDGHPETSLSNKANKKRSSDFFASAGQLLLSALPLLLAPTLGLMFAASPSPAARFQGPISSPLNKASGASAVPYTGLSSSPMPKLFTSAPPEYTLNNSLAANKLVNRNETSRLKYKTTQAPHKTIVLTTLGPPPFAVNESSAHSRSNHKNDTSLHANQTVILINTSNNYDESSNGTQLDPKLKNHLYDIGGYEGADFDAQFASLRKQNRSKHENISDIRREQMNTYHLVEPNKSSATNKGSKPLKNNQYQYSLVSPNQALDLYPTTSYTSNSSDEDRSQLYPIITWPTMRRRTVSLVTSNGSKTLFDSSDKYLNNSYSYDSGGDETQNEKYFPSKAKSSKQSTKPIRTVVHFHDDEQSEVISSVRGARRRRDVQTTSPRQLVKVVKKVVRYDKDGQIISSNILDNSNSTLLSMGSLLRPVQMEQPSPVVVGEPLKGDATKSKAHVITTMITHSAEPDYTADDQTQESGDSASEENDYNQAQAADLNQTVPEVEEELIKVREEAARKKLITKTSALHRSRPEETINYYDRKRNKGAADPFSAGGRGRFPSAPTPIEVTSTKIRLFANDSLLGGEVGEAQRNGAGKNRLRSNDKTDFVLTDGTRKALEKFNSLLIRDTFQAPATNKQLERAQDKRQLRKNRREFENNSLRYNNGDNRFAQTRDQGYEQQQPVSSATERSFMRTTPIPDSTNAGYNYTPNPFFYQTSMNRTSGEDHPNQQQIYYSGNGSEFLRMRPNRVNLVENEPQAGNFGSDDRTQAQSGEYYYNNGHTPGYQPKYQLDSTNRTSGGGESIESIDSRHSIYSNNSLNSYINQPVSQDHYGYSPYYPPPARRDPHNGYHAYPADHHHYNYSQPAAGYNYYKPAGSFNYQSATEPADQTSYAYKPPDYGPPQTYPPPPHKYNYPESAYRAPPPPPPPPPDHYAPPAPPRGYSRYQPETSASALLHQGGPLAVVSSGAAHDRSDTKAVNEYLKRVQFSDSDRDKLMASYLTCDGLLNDNDHCLERLSCEFSDPQNIEKANKLDRAVSSILLGHILINTYIPNQFKLRLKSASLFGYTQSGRCSRFACNKLAKLNANQ